MEKNLINIVNRLSIHLPFDRCKKCGCNTFECNNCRNNEFYRHIDNNSKKQSNLKIIKERLNSKKKCKLCGKFLDKTIYISNKRNMCNKCYKEVKLNKRF